MRLHSVLEPSVLHATEQEWSDRDFRLAFDRRLRGLLESVHSAREVGCDYQVLYSEMLQMLILDADLSPAWTRGQDSVERALWSLVFDGLLASGHPVEPSGTSLLVEPPLDERPADDLWLETTLELLTWAASQSEALVIDVGIGGSPAREASLLRDGAAVRVVPLCHDYREAAGALPLEVLVRSSTPEMLPALIRLWDARFEDAEAAGDLTALLDELPWDLVSMLRLVEDRYSDDVVVLDEAYRSAADSDFDTGRAWLVLRAMARVLPKLHFDDVIHDIEKEFEAATGFKLAMTDTKLTKQDKKAIAQRQRTYGSKAIDITPHVKVGNSHSQSTLRVHYYPDHETRRIVIGHCGDHLHTACNRR